MVKGPKEKNKIEWVHRYIFGSFSFRFIFTAFIFSTINLPGSAQTKISGSIQDSVDSLGIPFVSVILYVYQTEKIITYTQSDPSSFFSLEVPIGAGIYTLKTRHLGYLPGQQDIVISSESAKDIEISLFLNPKTTELEEFLVSGPIIVKEDTTIYDISHWTEARDQTLENVLSKIPGFKVQSDGEIQVNGQTIHKVIIDGEEISDVGAALITRSLAPEDVAKVEVRFDEKNEKLKESLLDTRKFVVLDITLKSELKKSLFGKIRGTAGFQKNLEPGGYLNGFSLKKKLKVHLFTEIDRFGEQTIPLEHIKNLGDESVQKLFTLPADFNELTERPEFHEEIFGFKDYTLSHKNILGFTSRYSINESMDIFFGSYNSYSKLGKAKTFSQDFESFNASNSFKEQEETKDYSSKSKLEFRYNKNKIKAKADINAVISKSDYRGLNENLTQNLNYDYINDHQLINYHQNTLIEYAPTKKLGLSLKTSISDFKTENSIFLNHNDTTYNNWLFDLDGNGIFNFNQDVSTRSRSFLGEFLTQYQSKFGVLKSGIRFQKRSMNGLRNGANLDAGEELEAPLFSGSFTELDYESWTPFLRFDFDIGSFYIKSEAGHAFIQYPDENNQTFNTNFLEYHLSFNYSPPGFSYISFSTSRMVSAFPLRKLIKGYELSGFQNILIPGNHDFIPTPELVLELAGGIQLKSWNLEIDPAILYGRVENANEFVLSDSRLIQINFNQLSSGYTAVTVPFKKSFKKLPLNLKLEPEWLENHFQNLTPGGLNYTTKIERLLLGLKLNTLFETKPFDIFLYPKISSFRLKSELQPEPRTQNMLSSDLHLKLDLFEKRLLFTPYVRRVNFFGNIDSNFTNMGFRIDRPGKKFAWFVLVDNLLNDTDFIRQTITPLFFISEANFVFERFFKVGLEYKFK